MNGINDVDKVKFFKISNYEGTRELSMKFSKGAQTFDEAWSVFYDSSDAFFLHIFCYHIELCCFDEYLLICIAVISMFRKFYPFVPRFLPYSRDSTYTYLNPCEIFRQDLVSKLVGLVFRFV